MEFAKTLAGIIKADEKLKLGVGDIGSVAYKFQLFPQDNLIEDTWMELSSRGLGSSFILSHNEHGILGSIADQPYLGDSRDSWVVKRVVSTGSVFREWFDTTTLKDSTTTAGWGLGSVEFVTGNTAVSKLVYFDSSSLTNARFTYYAGGGSLTPILSRFDYARFDYDRFTVQGTQVAGYLSADSGNNWESFSDGITQNFVNTGSALRWKIIDSTQTISLSGLTIEYNL